MPRVSPDSSPILRYRWVKEVANEANSIPSAAKMPPVITTGLGPNFVLRALPTGPGELEGVLRGGLRRPPSASSRPFAFPCSGPQIPSFQRVVGHRTQAQHSLPNCCTAIPMEAIQETLAACSSNAATNSTKKTPKERSTPNTSADWKNAESTTIHPQPPSGGSALRAIREGTKLQPLRAVARSRLQTAHIDQPTPPGARAPKRGWSLGSY